MLIMIRFSFAKTLTTFYIKRKSKAIENFRILRIGNTSLFFPQNIFLWQRKQAQAISR